MPGSQLQRLGLSAALMLVLVILAAIAGPALGRTSEPPAAKVLSLDEAVALAIQNSPEIKAEQFAVLKRQSQRAQAGRRPLCPA